MFLRLEDKFLNYLLSQPETGMGYQYVEAKSLFDYTEKAFVVNAELLIYEKEIKKYSLRDFGTYEKLLENADSSSRYIKTLRVISILPVQSYVYLTESERKKQPAIQATLTYTIKDEVFKRFSAFKNDRRITANKGLLPGAYATTEDDAKNARTGVEAVLRYALPNDDPAINVFTIKPPDKTDMKRGIVQPEFGKPGGGVEVLFVKGSPDKTVTGPSIIPER